MKQYIKDGQIRYTNQITIEKDGMTTYQPTEAQILADGWKEYIPPVVPEPTPEEKERAYWEYADYDTEVNKQIREKYSESQEFAILRQKEQKPQEYKVYFDYCEECKNHVKTMMAKYPRPKEEDTPTEEPKDSNTSDFWNGVK